ISASVSREHLPRAVRSVSSGREADDQSSCIWIAKIRNGVCPIIPRLIGFAFYSPDVLAPLNQSRAPAAGNDPFVPFAPVHPLIKLLSSQNYRAGRRASDVFR